MEQQLTTNALVYQVLLILASLYATHAKIILQGAIHALQLVYVQPAIQDLYYNLQGYANVQLAISFLVYVLM